VRKARWWQEHENVYMDALADFISRTSADMNNFSAEKQNKTAAMRDAALQVKDSIGPGLYLAHFSLLQLL